MIKLKSPIFTFTFSFLFLLLSLFPLLSSAQNQFLSTGQTCRPEVLTSLASFPNSKAQCPWCPDRGATKLRLSWDLPTEQTNPLCVVTCRRPDGQTCQGASRQGNDGLATSTSDTNLMNLGKKGELTLAGDIREGNEYTVSCCEKCPPGARPGECNLLCKNEPDSVASFPAQVVGECRQTCERPFEDIVRDLENFRPTTITEENFRGWGVTFQGPDSTFRGGSGEGDDLRDYIERSQCTALSRLTDATMDMISDANNSLSYLKNLTKNKEAGPFLILKVNEAGAAGGHVNIFLGIVSHNADYSKFTVKIWEPGNSPVIIPIERTMVQYALRADSEGLYFEPTPGVFRPYYFGQPVSGVSNESFIVLDPTRLAGIGTIMPALRANAIRTNTADWLTRGENQINFSNFDGAPGTGAEDGVCGGLTNFILRTAYLGDFSGTDYHPTDGNYVGEACGLNGAPLQKKKTSFLDNSFLWLASLIQSFTY